MLSTRQRRSLKVLKKNSLKSILKVGNLYLPSTTLGLEPVSIIHYTSPGSIINHPLHLAWIQYQAAHPNLINYKMPCHGLLFPPKVALKSWIQYQLPSPKIFQESSLQRWHQGWWSWYQFVHSWCCHLLWQWLESSDGSSGYGQSSQNWSEKARPCIQTFDREHRRRKNCRESWDKAQVGQQGKLMEPKANLNKDEMVNMIRHGASYVFSTKDGDITDIDIDK